MATNALNLDFCFDQGATFRFAFQVYDSTGAIQDLTGATFLGALRRQYGGPLVLDFSAGFSIVDAALGQAQLVIDETDTATLEGRGVFDIFLVLAGDQYKIVSGCWTVAPSVAV